MKHYQRNRNQRAHSTSCTWICKPTVGFKILLLRNVELTLLSRTVGEEGRIKGLAIVFLRNFPEFCAPSSLCVPFFLFIFICLFCLYWRLWKSSPRAHFFCITPKCAHIKECLSLSPVVLSSTSSLLPPHSKLRPDLCVSFSTLIAHPFSTRGSEFSLIFRVVICKETLKFFLVQGRLLYGSDSPLFLDQLYRL